MTKLLSDGLTDFNSKVLRELNTHSDLKISKEVLTNTIQALQMHVLIRQEKLIRSLTDDNRRLFMMALLEAIELHKKNNNTCVLATPWGQTTVRDLIEKFELFLFCD